MNATKFLLASCCLLALSGPAAAGDSPVSIVQASTLPNTPMPSGGNVSVIVQQGSDNYAESDQTGALNTDVIEQFGNNNSSKIVQSGVAGTVVDVQIGNGNQFTVTQTGINPPPVILVQHR